MKVVQINATCDAGSTGKICVALSKMMSEHGIENHILYVLGESDYPLGIRYMNRHEVKVQALCSRIFGNYGFNSVFATFRLLKKLEEIRPDIVHLHNLHSHNCNLEMLFSYLKKKKIRVLWTFHDCWAFTGYCTHFTMAGCDRWKTGCGNCPQRRGFSWIFDRSKYFFEKKQKCFSGLDMTIITPSKWMADLVKESFLKDYPVRVIYNGIDLDVFRPTASQFRGKHGISGEKKMLLGVAFDWSDKKGLDVFVELAYRLDPEAYQIVLVGTNEQVAKTLPKQILSICKTRNQQELAEIYTAADLFLNPTREEVLGLTNLEALACGTPVIMFDTGGSPECCDDTCGVVITQNDVHALMEEILNNRPCSRQNCIARATLFNEKNRFHDYLDVYLNKADTAQCE